MSFSTTPNKIVSDVPTFYKPLKDISTSQGECIVLECRFKGHPQPAIKWKREGEVIKNCLDFRILHKGEVTTLVIGKTFPEDSGVFACEATNKNGSNTTSCNVVVKGIGTTKDSISTYSATVSQHPSSTKELSEQHYNLVKARNFEMGKGQLIQEMTKIVKSPSPNHGKQASQRYEDYILYSPPLPELFEPQEYKVLISQFERRLMNEIEYRLESVPPVSEDPEDDVFEEVPLRQQFAPIFTTTLKNFKASAGTFTKFYCKVSAKPKAKVYWFKDGKQVSKYSQHYVQRSDADSNHELHIPFLIMNDDGNYTALAVNPKGRISCTGRLVFTTERHAPASNEFIFASKPRRSSKEDLTEISESPVNKSCGPKFIRQPAPATFVDESQVVRFDAKVSGLPKPNLEWLFNGKLIYSDPLHKILVRENNVHSLLIEQASPMDSGQYTIKATNRTGSATAHFQLQVSQHEVVTPPAFVQRLLGQCVAIGDEVCLEAKVVATPKPIICWKRDNELVISDHRVKFHQDDSGYISLHIAKVESSDAAWYTCNATNKAGSANCNSKLGVYSSTHNVTHDKRRIRTNHRYADLAKYSGVDMRETITKNAQIPHKFPE